MHPAPQQVSQMQKAYTIAIGVFELAAFLAGAVGMFFAANLLR